MYMHETIQTNQTGSAFVAFRVCVCVCVCVCVSGSVCVSKLLPLV
jgi:hypothetical protein